MLPHGLPGKLRHESDQSRIWHQGISAPPHSTWSPCHSPQLGEPPSARAIPTARPCCGSGGRKQDRDSAAPQPFLLRRHIPGDGDSLFPLGHGRGQGQLPSTGRAHAEGPKAAWGVEHKHGPGARFCFPPPASLVRTDPEAGQAEDAHAREGFARDAPCRIKPSRRGNCTAVGQGAAPSLWSCSE